MRAEAWARRWPGLPEAASEWLDGLPGMLAEAERRADGILAVPLVPAASMARIGRLAATTAPQVVPALVRRDGPAIVKALAETALNGGPTYVKIGQLISTTRGLVPSWIADAFAGCRDAVPPAPTPAIERTLRRSGVMDRVRSWNMDPVASASVAQVHEATLQSGAEVVIKVRRPGIVGTVAADVGYLIPALRIAEARNARMRLANLTGVVELMVRLFAEEVDLRLEAANIAQMAAALERAGSTVRIPAPVPGLVTKRALVMDKIDGVSSADVEGAAAFGHHAHDLVRLAIVGVLETAFVEGVFHGDLHPGNIIVTEAGLALVDFGIVGRLDERERRALIRLLYAVMSENRVELVEGLKDFGALPPDLDATEFVGKLPEPPTMEERRAMLRDRSALGDRVSRIVRALSEQRFRVPPELALFAKNLVYLGDAIQRHAPDFDIVGEVSSVMGQLGSRISSRESDAARP